MSTNKYSADALAAAVSSVKRKELSMHAAAWEYGVPRSTLIDHVADLGPVGRTRHVWISFK